MKELTRYYSILVLKLIFILPLTPEILSSLISSQILIKTPPKLVQIRLQDYY